LNKLRLQLFQFFRHLCGQVVGLAEIFLNVVQLPGSFGKVSAAGPSIHRRTKPATRHPAFMVDRPVCLHLKILRGPPLRCLLIIKRVQHRHPLDRLLGNAVTLEHYHDLGKLLFAFVFFWGYIATRYLGDFLPFLVLASAIGLVALVARLDGRTRRTRTAWAAGIVAMAAASIAAVSGSSTVLEEGVSMPRRRGLVIRDFSAARRRASTGGAEVAAAAAGRACPTEATGLPDWFLCMFVK
jgi:hypothetical protein